MNKLCIQIKKTYDIDTLMSDYKDIFQQYSVNALNKLDNSERRLILEGLIEFIDYNYDNNCEYSDVNSYLWYYQDTLINFILDNFNDDQWHGKDWKTIVSICQKWDIMEVLQDVEL